MWRKENALQGRVNNIKQGLLGIWKSLNRGIHTTWISRLWSTYIVTTNMGSPRTRKAMALVRHPE